MQTRLITLDMSRNVSNCCFCLLVYTPEQVIRINAHQIFWILSISWKKSPK